MSTTVTPADALAAQTPAQIDGKLFPIVEKIAGLEGRRANYRWLLGEVGREHQGGRVFGGNRIGEDGLEYNDPGTQRREFEDGKAKIEAQIAEWERPAQMLEDEFTRRGGWTRYLIVPGGHLHKRSCHTLTPGRTMVGQVAEASGLDPAEVVAKYDETACTHCFPDAPVAPKKTPAEEGFCEHSGEYLPEAKLPKNWATRMVAPHVRCDCGKSVAITPRGALRKHKAPAS